MYKPTGTALGSRLYRGQIPPARAERPGFARGIQRPERAGRVSASLNWFLGEGQGWLRFQFSSGYFLFSPVLPWLILERSRMAKGHRVLSIDEKHLDLRLRPKLARSLYSYRKLNRELPEHRS